MDKGNKKLIGMQKQVEETGMVANSIQTELDRQIKALDRVHDNIFTINSMLVHTGKQIRYFGRQIMQDKCIVFMICLVFIVIIVIVIMSMFGKSPADIACKPHDAPTSSR